MIDVHNDRRGIKWCLDKPGCSRVVPALLRRSRVFQDRPNELLPLLDRAGSSLTTKLVEDTNSRESIATDLSEMQ